MRSLGLNVLLLFIPFAWVAHWKHEDWGATTVFARMCHFWFTADTLLTPMASMLRFNHSVGRSVRLGRRADGYLLGQDAGRLARGDPEQVSPSSKLTALQPHESHSQCCRGLTGHHPAYSLRVRYSTTDVHAPVLIDARLLQTAVATVHHRRLVPIHHIMMIPLPFNVVYRFRRHHLAPTADSWYCILGGRCSSLGTDTASYAYRAESLLAYHRVRMLV